MSAMDMLATQMSALNLSVPFHMFRAASSMTGIGFRVVANGYNHYDIVARNPTAPTTFTTVDNHLTWQHSTTPWVSVFSTWSAAMRRAKWYTNKGARDVVIVVVDLTKINHSTLNVAALKAYISGFILPWHAYELLIDQGINEEAVVACIPAAGEQIDVGGHLQKIRSPGSLVSLLCEQTENAIRGLVEMEIYSRTGVWDERTTSRVMQSLYVNGWDDISVLRKVKDYKAR